MKGTLALILVTTTALGACTRVIERQSPTPAVVSTPAIIERSSVTGASSSPTVAPVAPGACLWEGQQTSNGGTSCRDHSQYRCNNGTWEPTASKC
jgi:hypothetical protein